MIVFFDVDGTIVDDETQILPESAVRAVEQLTQNGHLAVVNTGRPLGNVDYRVRNMAFSGWIAACGMEIMLEGKWLRRDVPDTKLCQFVRECVHRTGMKVMFEAEDALLRDGEYSDAEIANWDCRHLSARGIPVLEVDQLERLEFVKFCAYDAPGCRREEFLRLVAPWFTGTPRAGGMIEFVLNGHSKAQGMEEMLRALGADRSQVCAIGDTTNDLPMFRMAAHAACMGNGMAEAKAQAEFVTASVLENGLEIALRHFGLID